MLPRSWLPVEKTNNSTLAWPGPYKGRGDAAFPEYQHTEVDINSRPFKCSVSKRKTKSNIICRKGHWLTNDWLIVINGGPTLLPLGPNMRTRLGPAQLIWMHKTCPCPYFSEGLAEITLINRHLCLRQLNGYSL